MYDRVYNGRTINFEASGGLIHSSLVMQDFETDSYWAIMTGEAIAGSYKGTKLIELPVGRKRQWRDWVAEHPETLVLSIGGMEDGRDSYRDYFSSAEGFRGDRATDTRLKTKAPIFAFRRDGQSYALAHHTVEGGGVFDVGSGQVFLYRPERSPMFHSTVAYHVASGVKRQDGQWIHPLSGCTFDEEVESFIGAVGCPQLVSGVDTFWYNWSLNNPATILLGER